MKQHRTTSLVAGVALLLGFAPLTLLYKGLFDWMVPVAFTVAIVVGGSIAARALRLNAALQVVAMFIAMLLACTWQFSNGTAILGILPGPDTFGQFGVLMGEAGADIREQTMPVDSTSALVFLLVVGGGAMAILTEVFVSIMRIPALAGIPVLMLYLIPMSLMTNRIPWLLFVPGAVGYLWLLLTDNVDRVRRYGRRFSGDGRGIDRWEPSPLAGTGRWLGALVVGLALVLPTFVPGLNSNMLAGFNMGSGGSSSTAGGGTTSVSPWAQLKGGLEKTTPQRLGYVKTTEKNDPGYLKMWTADQLSEEGFGPDERVGGQAYPAEQGINYQTDESVESTTYKAEFNSTNLADKALPLYGYPTSVDVASDWKYDPETDVVSSESSTTKDLTYTFEYTRYQFTPDALRTAPDVSRSDAEYRRSTQRPAVPAVEKLSKKLTKDHDNQYDKVRAIYDHFSAENGYSYTLDTKAKQGVSDIEAFLENKEGYCQQYAASMAWLVREANIPARVSIGLTTGSGGENGYEVNSDNFHAWVEVYFQGFGWVPFDPTPSAGVSGAVTGDWAPDPDEPEDADSGEDGEDGEEGEDGGNTGADQPNRPDYTGGGVAGQTEMAAKVAPMIWPYWLAGGLVIAIVVLAPGLARMLRRRRRLSIPDSRPAEAAESAWIELRDTLTDLRIPVHESETSRTLARRLIFDTDVAQLGAAGIKHLAAAHERSHYAPTPPTDMTLRQASRAARFGLAATTSRFTQLRADLLPASLLTSWTTGMRTGYSAFGNGTAAVQRALGRLIPRRRSAS